MLLGLNRSVKKTHTKNTEGQDTGGSYVEIILPNTHIEYIWMKEYWPYPLQLDYTVYLLIVFSGDVIVSD